MLLQNWKVHGKVKKDKENEDVINNITVILKQNPTCLSVSH